MSLNKKIKSMYCIRCGKEYPVEDAYYGCPDCLKKEENSSMAFLYEGAFEPDSQKKGMMRYCSRLPYTEFPTLGEGGTPQIQLPKAADKFGLSKLYFKNESQNPTGSHKDRTSPLAVQRAIDLGKDTVVAASSGNAGASLAAYAALAGLKCKILATNSITPIWKASIQATGAELIITKTMEERWTIMKEKVENEGWYPVTNFILPPVGSNCFGIQGNKTIAYEIYEELKDELPDYILIPVSKGDLLWGVYEGFRELLEEKLIAKMPKLIAVEPYARIEYVLAGKELKGPFPGDASLTESIGGNNMTYQGFRAVKDSGGFAVSVSRDVIIPSVLEAGAHGMYLETSSAIVFGALHKIMENGQIEKGASVLCIATSNGFKNNPAFFNF